VTNPRHDLVDFGPEDFGGAADLLLEVAPTGCFILDCEGLILGLNEPAARLLGGRPECVAGRLLCDFVSAASRETLIQHMVSVQSGGNSQGCDIQLKLGAARTARWLRLRSSLVPNACNLASSVVCVAIEIDDLLNRSDDGDDAAETREETMWDPAYGVIPGEGEAEQIRSGRVASERDGPRVLVVDDDELFLNSTIRVLRRLGYRPIRCRSPQEALAAFSAEPGAFLAAVTDYRMPGMSGLELSAELRALRPDIPIMLVSGCTTDLDQATLESAGIRQLLAKPINVEKLISSLEDLTRG
jgi:CheY-like chemotaxis protein